jgi:cytochrome P450
MKSIKPNQAPNSLPIFGHVVPLLRDPLRFFGSLSEFGDLVRVNFGPSPVYIACSPELTDRILRDDRTYDKGGVLVERARETFGNGVATCPHDRHRRQRRLVQPAFTPARIATYVEAMSHQIARATASWHVDQPLDVFAEMKAITARTSLATMFAQTALSDTELDIMLDDLTAIVKYTYARMVMPHWMANLPVFVNNRFHRARNRVSDVMRSIITDRRAEGIDHDDLLSALLLEDQTDDRLTDSEIIDQCVTFFAAGTDTIATTVAWALHLLAEHPEYEWSVHTEISTVLGGKTVTYDDLPQLRTVGHVINETLRLYPPIWFFTRTVTRPTQLGAYHLPQGTTVAYSPYVIHHLPDRHPDPERFDPGRWTDRRDATRPSGSTMIPFGGGARKCIGDTLAMAECTLILSSLCAGWSFQQASGVRPKPLVRSVLHPSHLFMVPTRRRPEADRRIEMPEYSAALDNSPRPISQPTSTETR